ncbi:hypothetical protein L6452_05428 [Arctium lappa]|uniref:Uncharacterized protein n=1 Tax=Arctium lappa TaxID=4217 RepID=A0ACB9EFY2_ARCLA|nr:hypothetical protein L6452_05428 [Arctium lappa]
MVEQVFESIIMDIIKGHILFALAAPSSLPSGLHDYNSIFSDEEDNDKPLKLRRRQVHLLFSSPNRLPYRLH